MFICYYIIYIHLYAYIHIHAQTVCRWCHPIIISELLLFHISVLSVWLFRFLLCLTFSWTLRTHLEIHSVPFCLFFKGFLTSLLSRSLFLSSCECLLEDGRRVIYSPGIFTFNTHTRRYPVKYSQKASQKCENCKPQQFWKRPPLVCYNTSGVRSKKACLGNDKTVKLVTKSAFKVWGLITCERQSARQRPARDFKYTIDLWDQINKSSSVTSRLHSLHGPEFNQQLQILPANKSNKSKSFFSAEQGSYTF